MVGFILIHADGKPEVNAYGDILVCKSKKQAESMSLIGGFTVFRLHKAATCNKKCGDKKCGKVKGHPGTCWNLD